MSTLKFNTLEKEPIWILSNELAEFIYDKLEDFPDEEKWNTSFKLRGAANDIILFVSLGLGGESFHGAEDDWLSARKSCFALKTMYRFAGRQKFIELIPEIMIKFDTLIESIDHKIELAKVNNEKAEKDELKPWLEKYKLWKEIQK